MKRYDPITYHGSPTMEEDSLGDYVKYDDHVKEVAAYQAGIDAQYTRIVALKDHIVDLEEKNRVLTEALSRVPTEVM